MKLLLKRIAKKDTYTIGKLYIDGKYFCDTLEDKDRGLNDSMSIAEIQQIKIKDKTAIPTGTYKVTLNVISPKFSKRDFYQKNANGGRVPRILDVPGFDGVLIHCGTNEHSTSGCLIVGQNKIVGKVINSQTTFIQLYKILSAKQKESIILTIQ